MLTTPESRRHASRFSNLMRLIIQLRPALNSRYGCGTKRLGSTTKAVLSSNRRATVACAAGETNLCLNSNDWRRDGHALRNQMSPFGVIPDHSGGPFWEGRAVVKESGDTGQRHSSNRDSTVSVLTSKQVPDHSRIAFPPATVVLFRLRIMCEQRITLFEWLWREGRLR